jgi:hypothetical protein
VVKKRHPLAARPCRDGAHEARSTRAQNNNIM